MAGSRWAGRPALLAGLGAALLCASCADPAGPAPTAQPSSPPTSSPRTSRPSPPGPQGARVPAGGVAAKARVSTPTGRAPAVAGTALLGDRATWTASSGDWDEGAAKGPWSLVFDGYGAAQGGPGRIVLEPRSATRRERTHGALATTTGTYDALTLRARWTTTAQLRTGGAPNPWEVGWLLWAYRDPDHFYAVALKENGWEISKQDPAYPGKQRFLASGSRPAFAVGARHEVVVRHRGGEFTVWANGAPLATVRDLERPYGPGRVGLYCEDARVEADLVEVRSGV